MVLARDAGSALGDSRGVRKGGLGYIWKVEPQKLGMDSVWKKNDSGLRTRKEERVDK